MATLGERQLRIFETLESMLEDCASTLTDAETLLPSTRLTSDNTETLLQRCADIATRHALEVEPARIVRHFACTGGTVISKCISTMPNTVLLSEIDPFSSMLDGESELFFPTDLIRLLRASGRPLEPEVEGRVFLAGFNAAHAYCKERGLRLVLREHSHSQFCYGNEVRESPSMTECLAAEHILRCVVTVRHPLDSYLSLLNNNWLQFTPASLEEYARRYLAFLDVHGDVPIFKYEDFVSDPVLSISSICEQLELLFCEEAMEYFSAARLTGDSGRSSDRIAVRERRPISEALRIELMDAPLFESLCSRLQYTLESPGSTDSSL